MRNNLTHAVRMALTQYHMLAPGDRVLAGVSGGADSMAMLWVLDCLREELGFTLTAAHVNHGIRGAAALADQQLVEAFCRQRQIPLVVHRADIPAVCRVTGEGEEACGRRIRYAFFRSVQSIDKIATAHTLNDNAETLLMHLIRGTGLTGLCGIPPVRGKIIRPLLECSRAQVEDCCRQEHIPFAVDATNEDVRYTRNWVRHQLLPLCGAQNPAFLESVNRCVQANRQDLAYLQKQGEQLLEAARLQEGYDLAVLQQSEASPLSYGVQALLERHTRGDCSRQHRQAVTALIHEGNGCVSLPGGVSFMAAQGVLYTQKPPVPEAFSVAVQPGQTVSLPDGRRVTVALADADCKHKNEKVFNLLTYKGPDGDKIGRKLVLRNRRGGDRLTLPGRHCTKTLKKLFNEQKVAPGERARRLVLCDEQGVLWVEGAGCDARCVPDETTEKQLIIQIL